MKRKFAAASISSALLISQFAVSNAFAEEKKNSESELQETVVTANRYETPTGEVGSSVTVITAKEMEQRKKTTVKDMLREVPGLDVVQTGTFGGTTSVSMRGAKSDHTLVLLDGIEMNDASISGNGFEFANLTTDNIERIEVLRGPQSTLYGSQAIGGVINIITKRGQGKPKGFLSAEGGSYYTAKERAGVSGGTDLVNYSLGVSRLDTGGYSAASSMLPGNTEKDGYQNTSVNAKVGVNPHKNLNVDFMLNYQNSRVALDQSSGVRDDPNYSQRTEQISFRSQADLSLFNDFWQQKLGVSINDTTRNLRDGYDALHPTKASYSNYHGQTVKLDWQHILNLHKTNTLTVGVDRKEENAKSDSWSAPATYSPWPETYASNTGVYMQDQVKLFDSWFTTGGFRVDDHSQFGTKATYRFTSAYELKKTGTTFKGSYGTGFKAPSLYQLYAPTYGTSSLKAETSTGWDVGVEQSIPVIKTTVGATYFNNSFDNMITYSFTTNKYENTASAKSRGVETFVSVKPIADLTVKGSYTYTYAIDNTTGLPLRYTPKNKFALNTNYSFLDKKANANVGLIYVGTRNSSTTTNSAMKDYVVVNLAASYDVTKNIQLFGRVDNLFDRQYQEVNGWGTTRLAAYGGVKLSF